MEKITGAQRKKIYAVARELGIDNDLLHELVLRLTGKEHISELTKKEAIRVIDELEPRRPTRTVQRTGRQVLLATRKQYWMINKLAQELGWDDNPKRLQGFIKKYAKVDHPRWLTVKQASAVIEGLKALAERRQDYQRCSQGDA